MKKGVSGTSLEAPGKKELRNLNYNSKNRCDYVIVNLQDQMHSILFKYQCNERNLDAIKMCTWRRIET